ncbi:unnamed protein product, partial [Mesorhabditis belari]|uniref:Uncharacterized protein n=1 Tax=Mesorhabditis belari TaxID=2138241 RepID=A0AAF3J4G4_9BILA
MPVKLADIVRLKGDLVTALAQCATNKTLRHGLAEDFLLPILYFCIGCREHEMKPIEQFVQHEKVELEKNLLMALPRLEDNLDAQYTGLGVESVMRFRQLRSALQFLQDDIVNEQRDEVKVKMDELMGSAFLKDVDNDLTHWAEDREWDYDRDFDLRFVPLSHHWWLEVQREKSREKFGLVQPS